MAVVCIHVACERRGKGKNMRWDGQKDRKRERSEKVLGGSGKFSKESLFEHVCYNLNTT